jgi:ParB-like chromosome segregation protein Spo0J
MPTDRLELVRLPLAELSAPRENPRTIAGCERAELRASLRRFGFVEPVIVRRGDGRVIAGRQRLAAAAAEGLSEAPAVLIDCDDGEADVLALALNKTGGTWDVPALARMLRRLVDAGADLSQSGFTAQEIRRLTGRCGWAPLSP